MLAVWAARATDGLDLLVSIVNIGALCAFVLLHVSVVGFFVVRQKSQRYGSTWYCQSWASSVSYRPWCQPATLPRSSVRLGSLSG